MSTDPTLAAFEARIRGDRTVDPYKLYREINAGIARRDPRYLGRPLAWQTTMLDRWYKDLTGFTPRNEGDTLYDRLQKASILMEADLWAYEGSTQIAFKKHLFNSFRPIFYKEDSLDDRIKEALNDFLHSSRPYLSQETFNVYSERLREPMLAELTII